MKVIIDITGHKDPLNLILEVSGEARNNKAVKVDTARSLWIPAVNNHGSLGHWKFLEISDPWDLQNTIYSFLLSLKEKTALNHQSMINKTQGVCGGNARIRNTRIPVWTLVSLHKMGASNDDLLTNFPGLTQEDLNKTWLYYEKNNQEIDNAILEQDEDE